MATIDEPGPFDALEKAKPDEPVFSLLARDPCAPATITEWNRLRRNRALKLYGGADASVADKELLVAELKQCANAEEIALQFEEWRKGYETPDMIGVRASYNEIIKSAEELAEADRRKQRKEACANLQEARYHIGIARDQLAALGLGAETAQDDLSMMLARLGAIAEEFELRRPGAGAEPSLPLGA